MIEQAQPVFAGGFAPAASRWSAPLAAPGSAEWADGPTFLMASKRKKPQAPSKVTLVKTMARSRIGRVPAEQSVPDQRRKPEKHKKPWTENREQ